MHPSTKLDIQCPQPFSHGHPAPKSRPRTVRQRLRALIAPSDPQRIPPISHHPTRTLFPKDIFHPVVRIVKETEHRAAQYYCVGGSSKGGEHRPNGTCSCLTRVYRAPVVRLFDSLSQHLSPIQLPTPGLFLSPYFPSLSQFSVSIRATARAPENRGPSMTTRL